MSIRSLLHQRELCRRTRRPSPVRQPQRCTRQQLKKNRLKTNFFHLMDNFNVAPDANRTVSICPPIPISKDRRRYQETTVGGTSSRYVGKSIPRVCIVWRTSFGRCQTEHRIGHDVITLRISAIITWTNDRWAIVQTHLK